MVQPPPSEQHDAAEPATNGSLVDTIHKLHDLLFKAMLPKASGAKNINIPIEDLYLACSLTASACTSLQGHHANLQLSDINKKLETITTCLDTLPAAQPPANPSNAHAPTTGAKCPASTQACPGLCLNACSHRLIALTLSFQVSLMTACWKRSMRH